MSEFVGWVVVLGIVFALGSIYMFSSRVERQLRETARIIVYSNKLLLPELKRLTQPAAEAAEPIVGVILERRCAQRRGRSGATSGRQSFAEQRRTPGRRSDDFLQPRQAG
jgi:hypothetical protein